MADNLSQLLATPLQPLREQWRSAAQAELLRTARARHADSPDAYWTWVAERQRWMRPWDTVRPARARRLQLLRRRPDQRGRQLRRPLGAGPGHGPPRRRDLAGRAR